MKYVPGLLAGQLSGSAGSTVASHNRNGAYFRTRTIPVNPNSEAQQTARSIFTNLATDWRTLTEEQRLDWATLGAQMVRQDSLGVSYNLTGLQAFQSVNALRLQSGLAKIFAAPALEESLELASLSAVAELGPDALTLAFTPTPIGSSNRIQIWATRGVSAGRTFFGPREYRLVTTTAANASSPVNLLAAYTARFGPLTEGEKISFRARVLSSAFVAGPWNRVDVIVVAVS